MSDNYLTLGPNIIGVVEVLPPPMGQPLSGETIVAISDTEAVWGQGGSGGDASSLNGLNIAVSPPASAGQMLMVNSSANGLLWQGFSGDATISATTIGHVTVTGLLGMPLPTPTVAGSALTYNGSGLVWSSVGGGGFTAGGDLSGTGTSQTVIGIHNTPIASIPSLTDQVLSTKFQACLGLNAFAQLFNFTNQIQTNAGSVCGWFMTNTVSQDPSSPLGLLCGGSFCYPTFTIQDYRTIGFRAFFGMSQLTIPNILPNTWYFFAISATINSSNNYLYWGKATDNAPTQYGPFTSGNNSFPDHIDIWNRTFQQPISQYISSIRYFTNVALSQTQINAEAASPLNPVDTADLTYHFADPNAGTLNGMIVSNGVTLTHNGPNGIVPDVAVEYPSPSIVDYGLIWRDAPLFIANGDLSGTITDQVVNQISDLTGNINVDANNPIAKVILNASPNCQLTICDNYGTNFATFGCNSNFERGIFMSESPIDKSNSRPEISSGGNGGVEINLQEQFGRTTQFGINFGVVGGSFQDMFRVGGLGGPALSAEFNCALSLIETAVTSDYQVDTAHPPYSDVNIVCLNSGITINLTNSSSIGCRILIITDLSGSAASNPITIIDHRGYPIYTISSNLGSVTMYSSWSIPGHSFPNIAWMPIANYNPPS